MKLEDLRKNYDYHTEKVSNISRNLCFVGLGIIWIFKNNSNGNIFVPRELIPVAILLVIGLSLDLLHYISGSVIWGIYNRYKEKKGTKNKTEFKVPRQINWCSLTFFWLKVIITIIAYVLLLKFLFKIFLN